MKWWIGFLILAGCSEQPTIEGAAFVAPQLRTRGFAGDVIYKPSGGARHAPAPDPRASGTNVLYLNYDGVSVNFGFDDNAPSNIAEMGTANVPAFALWPGAKVTRQQAIDSVTDRIRGFYKPFDLKIVTSRPASGPYTMIAMGGKNTLFSSTSGIAAGVAILDCDNSNHNGVVFDFTEEQPPDYGGLPSIAITAAHESGHSFGLEHTTEPSDIMYSVADPTLTIESLFNARFAVGNYSSFNGSGEVGSCGRADPLDNPALLTNALAVNPTPGDTQAPTIDFPFPILQYVPTSFPISVTASDNTKVQRVEVYKNAELIAVLTQAPYETTVEAAHNESFYLTVEAIDPDANHKTVTRAFLAENTTPVLCPDMTCSGNRICKQGICRKPFGTECAVPLECEFQCKKPMGSQTNICTNSCSAARPCPMGFACGTDSLCAPYVPPAPKLLGEACAAAEECESMRCQETCVAACADGTGCEEGFSCMPVTGGEGCVVKPPSMSSGGCEMAPTPAGLPLALFVVLLVTLRIRSRSVG